MKIIGDAGNKNYLVEISHTEIEKVIGKYYGKLNALKVGEVVDIAAGYDFASDILSACKAMTDASKDEIARLRAEIERLTKYKTDAYASLQKKNDELYALRSTIEQQAERIAELAKVAKAYEDQVAAHNKTLDEVARLSAMIEKCEKFAADIPRNGSLLGFVSESARLDVLAAITKYKKVT